MSKSQKVTVQLNVTAPQGTSKTKIQKEISSLLKNGKTSLSDQTIKVGAPKVQETCCS